MSTGVNAHPPLREPGAHPHGALGVTGVNAHRPPREPRAHPHGALGVPDTRPAVAAPDQTAAHERQLTALRGQIDALDDAIQALVRERVELSHRIQRIRMNAGGTRVQLGRERVVHAGYRDALGPDGGALADAVLLISRGR